MFRLLTLATVLALATAPLAATDFPEIQKAGVLRVLISADEQPEGFNPSSEGPPGFERELIAAFARLHKLRLEPVVVTRYRDRIPALLEGRGDVIAGIIDTATRREQIAFTVETYPTRCVVVTHAPHQVVETPEALRREKVGLLQGTSTWQAAVEGTGVAAEAIESFPSLEDVIEALRDGSITATVMSASDMGLAKRKNPALQAGTVVGPQRSAAWGIRKQDEALRTALDEYITQVRKTPTWSRLLVKYFGEETLLVLGRR